MAFIKFAFIHYSQEKISWDPLISYNSNDLPAVITLNQLYWMEFRFVALFQPPPTLRLSNKSTFLATAFIHVCFSELIEFE